jgi:hypothetical protein
MFRFHSERHIFWISTAACPWPKFLTKLSLRWLLGHFYAGSREFNMERGFWRYEIYRKKCK